MYILVHVASNVVMECNPDCSSFRHTQDGELELV